MFIKFFKYIEDILFKSIKDLDMHMRSIAISIRLIITIVISLLMHISNISNKIDKVVATMFIGAAWISF